MNIQERFERKFIPEPNSGCWLWTGSLHRGRYGRFGASGKILKAHRVAYGLYVGEVGDKHVLHKCDNPACVNPDHLFLGTHQENMADMVSKKRHAKGETCGQSKLTEADVLAIREDRRKLSIIASDYGVSYFCIYKIKARTTWKHV